jgi:CRP-like cAMP-binding protein
MDEQGVIEKLRKIKIFQPVKDDEERLTKLARIFTWQQCKAGVEVISEGIEDDTAYILYSGQVRIDKRTPDQEPYTIVALGDDEHVFFGELALMDKEVRSASVTAKTDCEFLVMHRDDFIQLGEEDPRLGLLVTRAIAKELTKKLRQANQDMVLLFEALVEQVAESGGLEEG